MSSREESHECDRSHPTSLLRDYQRSFLVLVSRRAIIADLIGEMDGAASRVVQLIQQNVEQADQAMAAAIALATLFFVMIARAIVGPVRQMAGLLDDLAFGTPTGRVPTVSGAGVTRSMPWANRSMR